MNNSKKPSSKFFGLNFENIKTVYGHDLDKTITSEFEVLDGSMVDYPEIRSLNLSPKIFEK